MAIIAYVQNRPLIFLCSLFKRIITREYQIIINVQQFLMEAVVETNEMVKQSYFSLIASRVFSL